MHRRRLLRSLALGGLGAVAAACGTRADPDPRARRPAAPADAADGAGPGAADTGQPPARGPSREPAPGDDGGGAGPEEPDEPEEPAGEAEPSDDAEETPPRARRVEVLCRDALGLAAAGPTEASHVATRLTLHHSAVELETNARAPERLRGHQRYHRDQGWVDIAYHYAVDLAGNVYELRDPAVPGDTFTDYDPAGHLQVVCEGDFDAQRPTDALLDGVAGLVAALAARHDIAPSTLAGHRAHVPSTSCPGEHLRARIDAVRREAVRLAEPPAPGLARVCGEPGRRRVARIEAA